MVNQRLICAVIPAAGEGKRLGENIPKILVPITKDKTIWQILHDKLQPQVGHIHVVLSPKSVSVFPKTPGVTTSVQEAPIGMGDAIFGAYDHWKKFEHILIIWGDQVYVSRETLQKVVQAQIASGPQSMTIPVNTVGDPYVQYMFNKDFSMLTKIRQTREGDICDKQGLADVGTFVLSTAGLMKAWENYLKNPSLGEKTGEINFLPFLTYLSSELKWRLNVVKVADPDESRGINTPEDLEFFRRKYGK